MMGCEFCRMMENGDCGRDLKPLIRIGRAFETDQGVDCHTTEPDMCGVNECMAVVLYADELTLYIGDDYAVCRKVKYCPMCGREV